MTSSFTVNWITQVCCCGCNKIKSARLLCNLHMHFFFFVLYFSCFWIDPLKFAVFFVHLNADISVPSQELMFMKTTNWWVICTGNDLIDLFYPQNMYSRQIMCLCSTVNRSTFFVTFLVWWWHCDNTYLGSRKFGLLPQTLFRPLKSQRPSLASPLSWSPKKCLPPSCLIIWVSSLTSPSITVTSDGSLTVCVRKHILLFVSLYFDLKSSSVLLCWE